MGAGQWKDHSGSVLLPRHEAKGEQIASHSRSCVSAVVDQGRALRESPRSITEEPLGGSKTFLGEPPGSWELDAVDAERLREGQVQRPCGRRGRATRVG